MQIEIETTVGSDLDTVWKAWITPADIREWNAASEDWHTTSSTVDLREGGGFSSRMEAKDGSVAFDFCGTYTRVIERELIEFELEDGRPVSVRFEGRDGAVLVKEVFEAESELAGEQQRLGWQAILNNFARYVEKKHPR